MKARTAFALGCVTPVAAAAAVVAGWVRADQRRYRRQQNEAWGEIPPPVVRLYDQDDSGILCYCCAADASTTVGPGRLPACAGCAPGMRTWWP